MLGRGGPTSDFPAPVSFRSTASLNNGSGAVNKPSGVAVGDVAFVLVKIGTGSPLTLTTFSGGVWSVSASPLGYQLFYKILNATDVANNWNLASGGGIYAEAFAYVGNGATAVNVRSLAENGTGQSTLTLAGFNTDPDVRLGIISVIHDIDSAPALTVPSGFTSRAFAQASSRSFRVADLLGEGVYTGQPVIWTGTDDGGHATERAWLIEVTK